MKKWVCPVCGYVHEGDTPPAECPVCHVPGSKFTLQTEEKTWAAEHVVGVGKVFGADVPAEVQEEIIAGLRANFEGECSEVGMYLAMARVAHREGYPEIGMYWEKAGLEEAEHAAKFAELLGERPPASLSSPSSQRSTISMPSTTPCTKWRATRPATARRSRVCSSATSASKRRYSHEIRMPLRLCL